MSSFAWALTEDIDQAIPHLPCMTVSKGGKLEGDSGSKLAGDFGLAVNLKVTLAVNLKVMVTVSNGLSLQT